MRKNSRYLEHYHKIGPLVNLLENDGVDRTEIETHHPSAIENRVELTAEEKGCRVWRQEMANACSQRDGDFQN